MDRSELNGCALSRELRHVIASKEVMGMGFPSFGMMSRKASWTSVTQTDVTCASAVPVAWYAAEIHTTDPSPLTGSRLRARAAQVLHAWTDGLSYLPPCYPLRLCSRIRPSVLGAELDPSYRLSSRGCLNGRKAFPSMVDQDRGIPSQGLQR